MAEITPLLEVRGVTRSFPGALALDNVSFELLAGEVHALVGENGAGKSTLIRILSGVLRPDAGTIRLDGQPTRLSSPLIARRLGIATVHQEAEHFADLSVAENMALFHGLPLGRFGLVDWPRVHRSAEEAVKQLGEPIRVRRPAGSLSIGQQHMIQVAAAIFQRARIVILDEPTSALSESESEWLYRQIERLQADQAGIIYITHRQDEIFRLADRVTVLRDGRRVWQGPTRETDRTGLVEAMVGRGGAPAVVQRADTASRPAEPVLRLEVHDLEDRDGRFRAIRLALRAGEILGLYGLVGAGRSELAQAIFGYRAAVAGEIRVDGQRRSITCPQDAVAAGIAYVPEDRLRQALCHDLSVRANTVLASLVRWQRGLWISTAAERRATAQMVQRLAVRHHSIEQPIGELSGGNQQKVVLGRWLLNHPAVLILDEPTRGVDVGAKAEIHALLRRLAADGCAILLISSELPEVMQYADRIAVFRQGQISGEYDPATSAAAEIAAAALPEEGLTPSLAAADRRNRAARSRSKRLANRLPAELALAFLVVALATWTALSSEGFSIPALLANASLWVILGLAAAVVILAGGIDISIGSLLALSAAVSALVLQLPLSATLTVPLAVAAGVAVGGLGGALNAGIALTGRIHPIVVTLGTMTIYRGAVIALLGGQAVTGLPPSFTRLARDPASGIRGTILVAIAAALAVAIWLAYTRSGRYVYAIGSGPQAARLAGISRSRTWMIAFAVGGMLAGLAGVVQLAESGQMQSRLGVGWELHAIAVAVIGGVAITGGRGSVVGVVLGAILVRLINGALVRWGIRDVQFDLFVGGMILAAVLVDLVWRRAEGRHEN